MRLNLRRVVNSLLLNNQEITVLRTNGVWANGRYKLWPPITIIMRGIVTVLSEKELRQIPEGDQIKEGMMFYTKEPVYSTHASVRSGISDKIIWKGDQYKIYQLGQWVDYGYFAAVGERTIGD